MHGTSFSGTWGRLARHVLVLAGAVALAGCATGYAYVQPNVAGSGGYYTSDNAYTGQGYYDWYGTGPYYLGTSGWGYYNGAAPYAGAFGWFDGDDYYGFGFPFYFNLGFSNVWGFPGYWGPWYSINFPVWGCRDGCGRHHHWRGHGRHDHWHGHTDPGRHHPVIAHLSPPPGLKLERATALPRWQHGMAHPALHFAERRPLESASFAPHDLVRAPLRHRFAVPRLDPMPAARPAFRAPSMTAAMPRFAPSQRAAPAAMPRDIRPPPVFTPAPRPATHTAPKRGTEIP